MIKFKIEARLSNGRGRAGVIETPHGIIETPAFIPVGTKATVKSLSPEQIRDGVGAHAVLANTYHLYLQPGIDVLKEAGGLGKFMNWSGPTFTDSGGFQAFSLGGNGLQRKSKIESGGCGGGGSRGQTSGGDTEGIFKRSDLLTVNSLSTEDIDIEVRPLNADSRGQTSEESGENQMMAKVTDDGVSFKSIIDGSLHMFTPERSIEIQQAIGADIIFAFDECILPTESYERQKQAVRRTREWAYRCLEQFIKPYTSKKTTCDGTMLENPQALFGIIQGGRYEDLRKESARDIGSMDFDGFGIGGSFDKADIGTAVGWVSDVLPEGKPRHLLGIGEPIDIILGIENGIDTFDCVAPTRIARNGSVYVSGADSRGQTSGGDTEGISKRSDLLTINSLSIEDIDIEVRPLNADSRGLTSRKKEKDRINLMNACYTHDFTPIDSECGCYTCKNYTKAYLAHLFRSKEMFAATLASIHNLHYLVNLAKMARKAIIEGRFEEFKKGYIEDYISLGL